MKLRNDIPLGSTYDAKGNQLTYKDDTGYWREYTYNTNSQILTFKNSEGLSWERTYDTKGNELTHKDSEGGWWECTYDEQGKKLTYKGSHVKKDVLIDPISQIIKWQKDIGNNGLKVDALGVKKHVGYVLEECAEALGEALLLPASAESIGKIADALKESTRADSLTDYCRVAAVDAFCDIVVFGIAGLLRCGVDPLAALKAVADSNDSKRLADGSFVRNEHGKIIKPAHYKEPDFSGLMK